MYFNVQHRAIAREINLSNSQYYIWSAKCKTFQLCQTWHCHDGAKYSHKLFPNVIFLYSASTLSFWIYLSHFVVTTLFSLFEAHLIGRSSFLAYQIPICRSKFDVKYYCSIWVKDSRTFNFNTFISTWMGWNFHTMVFPHVISDIQHFLQKKEASKSVYT